MTIGAVAQQTGLRASTIRYYESVGLLPQPRRASGQRRYDAAVLERLAFIQITQRLGFSLTDIQTLFHNGDSNSPLSDVWQTLARQKLAEVEQLIATAHQVKSKLEQGLGCGCADLDNCIECVREQCA